VSGIKNNPSDKVYTPDFIVDDVLCHFKDMFNLSQDKVLEPFRGNTSLEGGGAFYNKLKDTFQHQVDWCEIDEGVDFLDYDNNVDWIITNPPYSIFKEILPKCLEVANHNIFVIPVNKLLSSMPRLMDIKKSGCGVKEVYYLGSGRQLGFPFGFPVAAVYIQKGWNEGWYTETYHERCYKAKKKGE